MTSKMLAEKVNTLFSLPDVALRVNELLNEDTCNNADLVAVIQHDPALTAKLLKIVNSAYFGFSGKIDTISRAVTMIGQKSLRNLVVATTVTESFKGIPEHLVDMNTFWYHSVTSGVLARLLAKLCHRQDCERFFIAGLLHSIGKLVFLAFIPSNRR
nr:HDOD domain-containing protein [Methylomarinum sp. Ch1-1]MDP4522037.1 HDOD domain-containing protein [Methylomarinum sp. Ch1-1]